MSAFRRRVAIAVCLIFPCLPLFACSHPEPFAMNDRLIKQTPNGKLRGVWADANQGIHVFRGVPFAKPPVCELRWRPPAPLDPWSGIKSAETFSAACYQAFSDDAFVWSRGEFARSEDCLYLNIWASAEHSEPLPVMIWFHGGAHTSGFAHVELFDGTELARKGVLVVTVNYRLGPWGFLAHPLFSAESEHNSSGNYGLLDKIAALEWVRDNIQAFGGDPSNVTIFGQSAGSMSVCALMASPLSQGLFHKAIGQSAACLNRHSQDPNGEERGLRLTDYMLPSKTKLKASDLRALSNDALLAAATSSGWDQGGGLITVDGWVLPSAPVNVFAAGKQAQVPVLLGSLANEGLELLPLNAELSLSDYDANLRQRFGDLAAEIKEAYTVELNDSPGIAERSINADLFIALPMRQWAGFQTAIQQPSYLYFMDYVPPAYQIYRTDRPDLALPDGPRSAGAYHSGELAFVFNNVGQTGNFWQLDDFTMADRIATYWTQFAKTGDPNSRSAPGWGPYRAENQNTMLLNISGSEVHGALRTKMDLLERYALRQGVVAKESTPEQ